MTNHEIAKQNMLRVARKLGHLLESSRFVEAISAHLLPDTASQARELLIVHRMKQIAALGCEETDSTV